MLDNEVSIGLMHNLLRLFFATFFSLKIGALFNFFHKNNLLFSYIENHIHIRHIMLYHFEKDWNAAQSFRDPNKLIGEGTTSKNQVEKLFKKFKSDDTNFGGDEGKGRP